MTQTATFPGNFKHLLAKTEDVETVGGAQVEKRHQCLFIGGGLVEGDMVDKI